jgi:hypothetical protein
MKNSKVILSLVGAAIAAMAAAPELMKKEVKENGTDNKNIIDLAKNSNQKSEEHAELSADVKNQMESILVKKTPIMKVSESVNVLVENYGSNDKSVKEKIYKDLKLAQNQDSTNIGSTTPGTTTTSTYNSNSAATLTSCHGACHSACHGACHGARGWRQRA